MAFENFKNEWSEMDDKFKWIIGAIVLVGVVMFIVKSMQPDKVTDAASQTQAGPQSRNAISTVTSKVLPDSPRNQGVEEMQTRISSIEQQLSTAVLAFKEATARTTVKNSATTPASASAPASSTAGAGLDALIPAVDFAASASRGNRLVQPSGRTGGQGLDAEINPANPATPDTPKADLPQLKIWPADSAAADKTVATDLGGPVIPVNSALESVMLSGINARPSGSVGGAVGSVNSANNVGAPFVTRLKGDAILPNGWKVSDIGDCFLGGSGIAVLSIERAYVIADNLSCVAPNGEVYEAPIKAYGLDVDGTLGIAGKVVSKQGALLMQSALTGIASGLGAALSPSAIPSYNSNATNGSTASVQFPNPAGVAQTAVGQGINQAASQLSKFYLDYAKETFPVVEVTSGTRVTWVLKESVELKRQLKRVALK